MKNENYIQDMVDTINNLYMIALLAKRWVELENEMTDADNHSCPDTEICPHCERHHAEYSQIMKVIKKATKDFNEYILRRHYHKRV